jgi:hypothetical protein
MKNQLLITEIQGTLNNVVLKIDANAAEFSLANWKTLKGKLSSSKLASLIQLNEGMLNEFEEALRQFYTHQNDSKKGRLACLRVALWLETITKNMSIPFEFEKALSSEEIAIKQVRALELIIRDVITEQLGGKENVILKLQELFKQDVIDKWIKSADQSGVLSGTTFSELSNILLDKNIFKGIEEIFHSSEIELSKSTRDSLRYILEDIRVIRNAIAHNKKVSNIQIEALNEYYKTIAEILKNAKKTQIDPDTYLDLSKSNMEDFIASLKEDNKEISGNIESIKKSIDSINVNIDKGFSEITDKNEKIHEELKSKWISKKFLVLYTIILTLSVVIIVAYNSFSNRKINTKIQLSWLSEKASYKFQELDNLSIQTANYKNDFFINSSGMVELTGIPSENLTKPIILTFKNSKIYQLDSPLIIRDGIIPIRISIKNLDQVNFIIRDLNTGEPVNEASIQFSGMQLTTDAFGKASATIPPNKLSKFIDIEVMGKGYKYYKLNDVLVNSKTPIEILLEK